VTEREIRFRLGFRIKKTHQLAEGKGEANETLFGKK
jgi:hypothetical protein